MGTEFIRNKNERFTKGYRRGLAQVQGDWIAGETRVTRVFRATADSTVHLVKNQVVLLRLVSDNQVVATLGVHQMVTLVKPSTALVERLKSTLGYGLATVHRLSPTTRRVDLVVEG
jgi:hypothetical protein